jgi:hypothetical protein
MKRLWQEWHPTNVSGEHGCFRNRSNRAVAAAPTESLIQTGSGAGDPVSQG